MNYNHEQFENIFAHDRKAALSEREREIMKDEVRLFIVKHPVRPSFYESLFARLQNVHAGLSIESVTGPRLHPVLAGLLIVFVGAGTSYAAENALPGDALYAVKTLVNEPVRAALAVTSEAKVKLNVALAERRLEEAGTLATEGRLTADTREQIEAKLDKHVKVVEARTSALAEVESALAFALDTQTTLEAALKAHESALGELAEMRPEIRELPLILRAVALQLESLARVRSASERIVARGDLNRVREFAADKRREVEAEIAKGSGESAQVARVAKGSTEDAAVMMMSAFAPADTALISEEATTTEEKIDPVIEALNTGVQKFDAGEYGEAFSDFQKAFRTVQEEKIKSSVRARLKLEGQAPAAALPFLYDEEDSEKSHEDTFDSESDEKKR